jgi:hypothetical protein
MARSLTTLVETSQPVVSPFGILSPAVEVVEDHSEYPEWISGYTYETPDGQTSAYLTSVLGTTNEETVIDINDPLDPVFRFYYPFGIRTKTLSSTFGTTPDKIRETAKNALDVVTQKSIEREFWMGTIAKNLTDTNDNRYLAQSGATDVTPTKGTAVKPHYGLALLEEALGNATIGSAGTIHGPISTASALKRVLHVDTTDGNKTLITPNGNTMVSGTGYTRVGPDGTTAPANQAWMYATGPVTVFLSDIFIVPEKQSQAVDTLQNNIAYYGERYAGVTWSTANLYAVLVDLTADYA